MESLHRHTDNILACSPWLFGANQTEVRLGNDLFKKVQGVFCGPLMLSLGRCLCLSVLQDLEEDRESDRLRTPGFDPCCYIKPCKQFPGLSTTSASAPGFCLPGSPFLESTLPLQLNPNIGPTEASPSVTWIPLFIYISIGRSMFYSSHFTARLRFCPRLLSSQLHFPTWERTIACSGEREQMSAQVASAYRRIHPHAFWLN